MKFQESSTLSPIRPQPLLIKACIAFICAMVLVIGGPAPAAVITAADTSFLAVTNAVALANDGDTVVIPAGAANWTNGIYVTAGITIQGAGVGSCIITDNVVKVGPVEGPFYFKTVSNKFYRLTGVQIMGGNPKVGDYSHGVVQFRGTSHAVRMDHCQFESVIQQSVDFGGDVCGVVDHCTFNVIHTVLCVWHQAWQGDKGNWGDKSWATPVDWGGTNTVVMEDCNMTRLGVVQAMTDSYGGGRFVVRYCNITNGWVDNHGTETTGRYRGCRNMEVYHNLFVATSNATYTAIDSRSGSAVVWSNTTASSGVGTYSYLLTLNAYRSYVAINPWGVANGFNVWDSNYPGMYGSGLCNSVTYTNANSGVGYVTDTNANWSENEWIGYTLVNTNTGRAANIKTNSSNVIVFAYAPYIGHPEQALTFQIGDGFQIYKVSQILDQPGLGSGDLLGGDNVNPYNTATGLPGWPHQVTEGVYVWGNSGTSTGIVHPFPTIQAGRDVLIDTVKPSYKPLVYPHPLTTAELGLQPPSAFRVVFPK